jgi:hypothetical protein
MKKLLLCVAAITVLLPLINGCKKGEGDPLLSLRSRKERVAGEWTIDHWEEASSYSSSNVSNGNTAVNSGTITSKINGAIYTTSQTYADNSATYTTSATGNVTARITFTKDGTFTRTIECSDVHAASVSLLNYDSIHYEYTYDRTTVTSGTWNFLGGIEAEYKSKERIILNILQEEINYDETDQDGSIQSNDYSYSYANGESSEIWQVTTLKNKEMDLLGTIARVGSYSHSFQGQESTSTNSNVTSETGTITGKLTQ